MSRVDEAMRRAAEQARADSVHPPRPDAPGADTAVEPESFPVERASSAKGGMSVRPSARSIVVEPTSMGADDGAAHTDAGSRADGQRPGLFDRMDGRLSEKVVIDRHMMPSSREQYRRLAATLHDAQSSTGIRVVMIASATAGEGKTLTATNLALTFSESYQKRVLLIDADLRKPTLHQTFRIDTTSGLSEGLSDPEVKLVVRQISSHLSLLPAGRPMTDPMAGLISARMAQLVEEAKESFDWVILDTPPLGILPDAHLLTSLVEGTVMVVKADSTPFDLVKRSVEAIGRTRILGVVLNSAHPHGTGVYGYGYSYGVYGYAAQEALTERP
jgi:capsular exopolysaccharide synthesis family protein